MVFVLQDNCQEVLVQQVNPQICQDNKSLLKHTQKNKRQLSTGNTAALISLETDLLM
jgi:hypothetical protein